MAVGRPRWPTGARPPRVRIEFREDPSFFPKVKGLARRIMKDTGAAVKKQAQHNVAPGIGPGPHPHRTPHEDTGVLRKSIFYRTWETRMEVGVTIGTDLHYGLYLEVGWHSSLGNFWKYPWLWPAMMTAAPPELEASASKLVF